MSNRMKFAVIFVVTAIAAMSASLMFAYMWDSALQSEDASVIASALTGIGCGHIAFVLGSLWFDVWADQ